MKLFEHPTNGWRWRWMQSKCGDLLHRVRSGRILDESIGVGVSGSTLCGIQGNLYMPGLFSRLGARRCKVCCRILSIPEGDGAPANQSKPHMKWMEA